MKTDLGSLAPSEVRFLYIGFLFNFIVFGHFILPSIDKSVFLCYNDTIIHFRTE